MPEARKIHEQTAAKEAVDKRRLLVLLDLSAKPEQAGDDLAHIRSVIPEARIVVLIDASRSQILTTCLVAGARGFLTKDISGDVLLRALCRVMSGHTVIPTRQVEKTAEHVRTAKLRSFSKREVQILRCLVRGDSNKIIANRLKIAEATVKVRIKSLLRKINVRNRTQAAIWAWDNGLRASANATEAAW